MFWQLIAPQQKMPPPKVERQVGKSAAALLLESRIGEQFDAIVTGASDKGTWVWILTLPVEGKLVRGFDGLDVGDRLLGASQNSPANIDKWRTLRRPLRDEQ